eukprot:SAG22_NODE_98_length_20720_cov_17.226662_8_plen_264_part_00
MLPLSFYLRQCLSVRSVVPDKAGLRLKDSFMLTGMDGGTRPPRRIWRFTPRLPLPGGGMAPGALVHAAAAGGGGGGGQDALRIGPVGLADLHEAGADEAEEGGGRSTSARTAALMTTCTLIFPTGQVSSKALPFCCAPTVFLSKTVPFLAVCLDLPHRTACRERERRGAAALRRLCGAGGVGGRRRRPCAVGMRRRCGPNLAARAAQRHDRWGRCSARCTLRQANIARGGVSDRSSCFFLQWHGVMGLCRHCCLSAKSAASSV